MVREDDRPDRFASGMKGEGTDDSADSEIMPGVIGGGKVYLNESVREDAQGAGASSAEGTIGAVGEMDITGAPVGASGISRGAGESEGGGPGGGVMSRGGTGPGPGGSDND